MLPDVRSTVALPALIVLLALMGAGCSSATHTLQVNGVIRSYRLHVPEDLPEDTSVPLLLALHQFADTARGMERMTGLNNLADAEGFIVAYPQGKQRRWNSSPEGRTDDVAFLDALLDALLARYPVDADRIYATGASAGAMMVQFYACQRDRLAAIAPVMGPLREEIVAECRGGLPVLYMHGLIDPIIPYGGGLTPAGPNAEVVFYSAATTAETWAALNDCGTPPEMTKLRDDAGRLVAVRFAYACAPDRETLLYAVRDHGHTWPGGRNRFPRFIVGPLQNDFDASATLWAFFMRHRRNG